MSPETKELDFEVELVIVIGKAGKKIAKEDAMAHVAGYTVAHDVSARDWQLKKNGGQWLLGAPSVVLSVDRSMFYHVYAVRDGFTLYAVRVDIWGKARVVSMRAFT